MEVFVTAWRTKVGGQENILRPVELGSLCLSVMILLGAGCPLVRILTGKSGYLDDVLFLSGLSGYMGNKWPKNPKIRIFCISPFKVSGWCQDFSEISIHSPCSLPFWYPIILMKPQLKSAFEVKYRHLGYANLKIFSNHGGAWRLMIGGPDIS